MPVSVEGYIAVVETFNPRNMMSARAALSIYIKEYKETNGTEPSMWNIATMASDLAKLVFPDIDTEDQDNIRDEIIADPFLLESLLYPGDPENLEADNIHVAPPFYTTDGHVRSS